jgi:hypothetical protein
MNKNSAFIISDLVYMIKKNMILDVHCHCSTLYTKYVDLLKEIHIIWDFIFGSFSAAHVETSSFRSMLCAISCSIEKVDSPVSLPSNIEERM